MSAIVVFPAIMVISGCVSSTLDSTQLRPVGGSTAQNEQVSSDQETVGSQQSVQGGSEPVSLANSPTGTEVGAGDATSPLDPAARERAVSEMRAKAASGSGEKTQIGAIPETAGEAMGAQKQRELSAELENSVEQVESSTSDAELAEKRKSIEALRRKAKSHYSRALKRIEE